MATGLVRVKTGKERVNSGLGEVKQYRGACFGIKGMAILGRVSFHRIPKEESCPVRPPWRLVLPSWSSLEVELQWREIGKSLKAQNRSLVN